MAPCQVILEPEAMGEIHNTDWFLGACWKGLECPERAWLLSGTICWRHFSLHLLLALGSHKLSVKERCKEHTVVWALQSFLKLAQGYVPGKSLPSRFKTTGEHECKRKAKASSTWVGP